MNIPLFILLTIGCVGAMLLEGRGLPTTLSLSFKGDIKRESRWLAQYGQMVCSTIVALLVWRLDRQPQHRMAWAAVAAAVGAVSVVAMLIKRLLGRIRPGRPDAGKFLGPSWKHANYRESFPSSHSASAVALSAILAHLYPGGAEIFWALALVCAVLRYLMDAHWPSDVLGGIALGYASAHVTLYAFGHWAPGTV